MINVIGLGYIGLPTALILAASGNRVVGSDINEDIINKLNSGEITFSEKGLLELFHEARKRGVEFSTDYKKADTYIIAVPTPYIKESKKLDPSFVIAAVNKILDIGVKGSTIIIESTMTPGTIDNYIRPEIRKRGLKIGSDIKLVHAPERIIPGNMLYELINNSRVLGVDDIEEGKKIKDIYKTFCKGEIIITDIRSSEMVKVVENAYRDVNIAFANELAKICGSDGMDVYEIIKIANKHPRVNILQPGPGVGGHCISVDPWFLVGDYPGLANLILTARKTNDSMPRYVINRISEVMKIHGLKDIGKVGLYGLSYKEDIDDTRNSPSLQLLDILTENMAFGVKVYDPNIKRKVMENQYLDFNSFLNDIKVLVIMVGHKHIKENMDAINGKIIVDTKNICNLPNVYKL